MGVGIAGSRQCESVETMPIEMMKTSANQSPPCELTGAKPVHSVPSGSMVVASDGRPPASRHGASLRGAVREYRAGVQLQRSMIWSDPQVHRC